MDGGKRLTGKPFGKPADMRIVDTDVHIHDTPQAIAPYCEMPWRESLNILGRGPARYLDIPGFAPSLRIDPPIPGGHGTRSVHNAKEMREELDLLGVDDGILLPDHLLLFAALPNPDYATALSEAYNRWMCAEWLEEGNGLHGTIMACPQNPEASAKEILRYAGKPGVVGVFLPTAGVDPLWGHRRYDPIMRAAEEAGFPVVLHSVGMITPAFPMNTNQFENNWGRHVLQHVFAMMANLTSLMHTGVPERYPNLQFVFTEAGIGWVPDLMWRMDRGHSEYRRLVPFMKLRPSEYMRRQMWFCTQPLEESESLGDFAETMKQFGGEDRVVYASDWPHHDFDHPSAVLKQTMTREQQLKVMGGNAVKLFKLPEMARPPALVSV